MKRAWVIGLAAAWCALVAFPIDGQSGVQPEPLTTAGQITVNGHTASYKIRHLPVYSFPRLPASVQNLLNQRGCMIPQTYEAHQPENVIEASLERRGSTDWAVLCSAHGMVSLLVFFGDDQVSSNSASPTVLATAPETERLQAHGAEGALGFDWGIDPATPEQVREAQAGMQYPPPKLDHDALVETVIDQGTVYHYYSGNAWTMVRTQD